MVGQQMCLAIDNCSASRPLLKRAEEDILYLYWEGPKFENDFYLWSWILRSLILPNLKVTWVTNLDWKTCLKARGLLDLIADLQTEKQAPAETDNWPLSFQFYLSFFLSEMDPKFDTKRNLPFCIVFKPKFDTKR